MYVQRENGAIIAAYGALQPCVAEEEIADDDAELLAYLSPLPPPIERHYSESSLAAGFAAMGFSAEQIDAFFRAASNL